MNFLHITLRRFPAHSADEFDANYVFAASAAAKTDQARSVHFERLALQPNNRKRLYGFWKLDPESCCRDVVRTHECVPFAAGAILPKDPELRRNGVPLGAAQL